MNAKQFFELAVAMRKKQRAWYKDHKHPDLVAAKQLEKQMDEVIEKGLDEPTEPKQASLFTEAGNEQ